MITVVLPAYNEEDKIGRVVRGLFEQGFNNVVVVDDGSTDQTGAVAESAGAVVLKHEINRGQGATLQTGNVYAVRSGAETVVHFDADDQFNPADIHGAVKILQERNLDIIFGSRFLDGRSRVPWFKKYFVLPVAKLINNGLTGLKLTDAHNGFRVLNRRALEAIQISQDGMAHNTEIVWQVNKAGLKWAECPVEVRYAEYGQGISGGITVIKDWLFSNFTK
ncbi:MAG: glycosyltransferase family 2 protein [bacterium]|nr:glycosyltransferase family 2 protein [bacterium]